MYFWFVRCSRFESLGWFENKVFEKFAQFLNVSFITFVEISILLLNFVLFAIEAMAQSTQRGGKARDRFSLRSLFSRSGSRGGDSIEESFGSAPGSASRTSKNELILTSGTCIISLMF